MKKSLLAAAVALAFGAWTPAFASGSDDVNVEDIGVALGKQNVAGQGNEVEYDNSTNNDLDLDLDFKKIDIDIDKKNISIKSSSVVGTQKLANIVVKNSLNDVTAGKTGDGGDSEGGKGDGGKPAVAVAASVAVSLLDDAESDDADAKANTGGDGGDARRGGRAGDATAKGGSLEGTLRIGGMAFKDAAGIMQAQQVNGVGNGVNQGVQNVISIRSH